MTGMRMVGPYRSGVNSRLSRPPGRLELVGNWPMPSASEVTFSFIPPARNSASRSQLIIMQFQFLKLVLACFQFIYYIKAVFDLDAKQQNFHRALVCNGLLQQLLGLSSGDIHEVYMKWLQFQTHIRSLDWFTIHP